MRYGAIFIGQSPEMRPASERYAQVFEQVRLVDALGFDHVWFTEHHFSSYAMVVNPFLMTVHAATLTRHVRFVQGVTVLPWWHPLRLAEDIAITDVLTGGRLEVGLGRGYAPYEFAALNLDASQRAAMFQEGWAILEQAWRDGTVHAPDGRFWPVRDPVTVIPAPLQRPHPRVWTAAGLTDLPAAAQRGMLPVVSTWARNCSLQENLAALRDLRTTYDAALSAVGGRFDEFASLEMIHVADTDEQAYTQMEHAYWLIRTDAQQRQGTARLTRGRHAPVPWADEPAPERWRERLLFGSPETCLRKLRGLAAQGVTYVVAAFDIGAMDHARVLRSIELFATRVMPALAASA